MAAFVGQVNECLYSWVLLVLLLAAGLYFTVVTGAVQLRGLREAGRVMTSESSGGGLSAFGALMVSTASRVGTGNIVGVSTALCLGGVGSIFWLLLSCVLGAGCAFAESTLAQVYKRRSGDGTCYGGPACYIEASLGRGWGVLFCLLLMATHGVGFNLLSAYNLQSSFSAFSFYNSRTPLYLGLGLALSCFAALRGKTRGIERITGVLVPLMGLGYAGLSLVALFSALPQLPTLLREVCRCAFDVKAMAGGFGGSCLMLGLRRGLFSTEAGMGSSPNAAAAVETAHPVTQGLSQMLSVYIDALLCLATAVLCLGSGVSARPELAGMAYVTAAAQRCFGPLGPGFIAVSMVLFAFSSLVGNMFYLGNCLRCIFRREPGEQAQALCRWCISLSAFVGCGLSMELVWELSDLLMGLICLLHLPVLFHFGSVVRRCWQDYQRQRSAGQEPLFRASDIGVHDTEYWR